MKTTINRRGANIALLAGLMVILPTFSSLSQAAETFRFKQANSNWYLTQTWGGNKDNKRNVTVWRNGGDDLRWALQPAGQGFWYLVNMKTGLVLTQDGSGDNRNVSTWGRRETDSKGSPRRQQWRIDRQPNSNLVMIVNRETNQGLTQHDGGRNVKKNNVTTWPGQNWRDRGFLWHMESAGPKNLAKLTLLKIKCVKPSTGQDGGTKFLFSAIEFAITTAAIPGGSAAISAAGKTALRTTYTFGARAGATVTRSLAKTITKKEMMKHAAGMAASASMKKVALESGNQLTASNASSLVELAFNKAYGESPDQLEILINNVSVWPNGGRDWRYIKSQQTLEPNFQYIFDRSKGATIQLIEYDSGSSNDSLGSYKVETGHLTRPEVYEEVPIIHKGEGSIYLLTYKIEPL